MGMDSGSCKPAFDCILFDLDDTLYPSSVGIAASTRGNIEDFLAKKCGVSEEKASTLRAELFSSHGSSLAGLRALGYDVDPDEYYRCVHGPLPYEAIQPDPQLRQILRSIRQTKIVFTNSDRDHARKVLERLGIEEGDGCFQGLVCFETLNPHVSSSSPPPPVLLKPSVAAVEAVIRIAGTDPRRTLFLDDSERNIAAGKRMGFRTALVGKSLKSKEADYLVESINDLQQVIPEIWKGVTSSSISTTRKEVMEGWKEIDSQLRLY